MYRSESVFDISSDEEMSEMSCDEYPVFRTKESKKKTCGEKEGGKLTLGRTRGDAPPHLLGFSKAFPKRSNISP